MRIRRSDTAGEEGAVLLTVVIAMVVLLSIAALVLDLGAVRANRAASQTAADSAATAAAIEAKINGGTAGCEAALDYLEAALPGSPAFTGSNCVPFPKKCTDTTGPRSTTATAANWVVTLTYPVPDGDALLQPSTIGSPGQALHADDGHQCDRFGVSVQSTHDHLFAGVLGATSQSTEIRSVARAYQPPGNDFALNLLILERYDCDAVEVSTSGSGGGIIVDAVLNPDTGLLDPGFIAVDSDASGSCGPDGVIDVNGSSALIRADGPAGCDSEIATHIGPGGEVVGEGCGSIELLAPGTPGCNYPACTSAGIVAPPPIARTERITRAPVDHRYNCKAAYPFPLGWGIDPCNDAPAPYIDNLVAAYGGVGTPAGFTSWTGAGYGCNINSPTTVPAGNWHIDCANLQVKDVLAFEGGDVVLDGGLTLTSTGVFATNADVSGGFPFVPASDEAVVYFRNGQISKGGQGGLLLHHTMVYLSATSDIKMTGGSGPVSWSAPIAGDFEDLALWAEATADMKFAGGAGLNLEGVFFAPWALIDYTGSGSQVQVEAQFIARRLAVSGNGRLVVRPGFTRAVLFPFDPQSQLIR